MNAIRCITGTMAVFLMAGNASAQSRHLPPLDYERTIREGSMVLIPYIDQTRGQVFFTEYEQIATETSRSNAEIKRLFVNLRPTPTADGEYASVLQSHGITDAKVLPFDATQACKPADNIVQLLSGMPAQYKPSVLGGNYPIVCTLSVYFLREDETKVRALIAAEPVIRLHATVPLCASDSPRLDTPLIVDALHEAAQALDIELQTASDGALSGNDFDVPAAVYRAASDHPELFEKPDVVSGRRGFLTQFIKDADTLTLPANRVHVRTYACRPAPLEIAF